MTMKTTIGAGMPPQMLPVVICFHWILQIQRHLLLGDPETALEYAEKAKPLLWSARCHIQFANYRLYEAFALAAAYGTASPEKQAEIRSELSANAQALQRWAESCPVTFSHKHLLLCGELARVEGRAMEAMQLYERAARSAAEHGFVQDQALANELAGQCCLASGLERAAHAYLLEARHCYLRWGADGKVGQLDQLYPHLREQERAPSPMSTIGVRVEHLDLATVMKVSQAISAEIVLEKLLDTLMRTALEQAGAARGVLILARGAEHRIAAEATTSGDTVSVHLRDDAVAETVLPASVLNYVLRTQESVILDDAAVQNRFPEDTYISQNQARSILCLPLLHQAKVVGVLYLENNLAPRVFVSGRIAMLKLVASQAAISLENTRLYRDLAQREAKIRRLVDANIIGIFIWDFDGRVLEANDEFLRMVNYDREDLVSGRIRWTDLTPPDWRDRNNLRIATHKSSGHFPAFEKEYTRKDGTRVPVLMGGATFEEGGNQGVAYVLDLTERKRAREEHEKFRQLESDLAHMNRLSVMGELTASLVHEITQPIATARNNARAATHFLNRSPPELVEVKEALACVAGDTDRARDIIDRLRDHIKKAPPRKDRFDLNEAIDEVVRLVQSAITENRVSVRTRLAEVLPPVQGDRVQLQQVVMNLILNAIEAMSSVEIAARQLLIQTEQSQSGGVLVAVRDSGPGIDPERLEGIFEAFYTTKSSGVGMGLSICRSIIDSHGGRLWAEVNAPRGAVFQFTLPSTESS